jgi:hypothetical protein
MPPRADLADTAPEFAPARAAATRADALLTSAQSPLADEAKALAAKPATALRILRERQVDLFITALPLHSMRTGVWVVHQPGMLAKLAKQSDRDAVLAAAGSAGGRITLTIDARNIDGTGIIATLASTDQPEKKKFTGRLQVDASANRILLNLRTTQPPSKAPTEAELKRVFFWSSILLELRGNSLIGIATAGPPETATVLNVAFGSPTAAPAPTPAPQKAPAPKPAK